MALADILVDATIHARPVVPHSHSGEHPRGTRVAEMIVEGGQHRPLHGARDVKAERGTIIRIAAVTAN